MKTFPALLVKSDGLIYAAELPEEPKDHPNFKSGMDQYSEPLETNGFWQKQMADYEAALASAKESAVLCADQGKAKEIIKAKFGHDIDQMTINTKGYEYPIPDLQWEVVAKPVKEGFEKYNFERVAILKESTPSTEQESQEELWNEVLQIAGPYDGREEAYRTAMRKFKSRFIITRRKP